MVTRAVLSEYHRLRRNPYSRAGDALRYAKRRVWVGHNWTDFDNDGISESNDGLWRLQIVPDEYSTIEDLEGDLFDVEMHKDTVPGGKRTIEAQRKEFVARIERDGVWGYVLERRVPACKACGMRERWEHVDSCYGFEGEVYEDALTDAQWRSK